MDIILVVLLTQVFWFQLVNELLRHTDFFGWVYGPEFVRHLAQESESPERKWAEYRIAMWLSVLCLPLNLSTVLGACRLLSGTQPYQLGVTTHRLARNTLIGILGAIVVAPLHVLHLFLVQWYTHVLDVLPQLHPLTEVALQALPVDKVMIVLSAMVAAPVMEELVFRGLLQPWFIRQRWGSAWAVFFALMIANLRQASQFDRTWTGHNWRDFGLAFQPAAFVLLMGLGLLLTRRPRQPDVAGGIFGSALLFAAAHSAIWPSPVPLLALGLVQGWLYQQTRSLVGPIALHSLFNSVACVTMFWPTQS